MATSKIEKVYPEVLNITVDDTVLDYTSTNVKAVRYGNVVTVSFWGCNKKVAGTAYQVITGLPLAVVDTTTAIQKGGNSSNTVLGNAYINNNASTIAIAASTTDPFYGALTYICK